MERNTVERAGKTKIDAKSRGKKEQKKNRSGQGRLGYFNRHKPWHPHHVKVSPRERIIFPSRKGELV